jgi:hypothetical protein
MSQIKNFYQEEISNTEIQNAEDIMREREYEQQLEDQEISDKIQADLFEQELPSWMRNIYR